ncbi:MAG: hypothetical protein ACYDEY_00505 [Acidimicrobiales bacterium]
MEANGKAIAAAIDTHATCVATGEVVPLPPAGAILKLDVAADGTGIPAVPGRSTSIAGTARFVLTIFYISFEDTPRLNSPACTFRCERFAACSRVANASLGVSVSP